MEIFHWRERWCFVTSLWMGQAEGALPGHTPLVATGVWTLLVWPCLNHRLPQVPKDWFPARCWWSSIWSIFHYFSSLRYVYRVESSEQIKTGSGLSERLCKLLLFMLSTSWHPLLSRRGLTCREAVWSSMTVCAGSGWYTKYLVRHPPGVCEIIWNVTPRVSTYVAIDMKDPAFFQVALRGLVSTSTQSLVLPPYPREAA